jgi:hypothetical protein
MIKIIGDNYKIYGLIIVKTAKNLLMLDYGLSNATFEPPNHAFSHTWYNKNLPCGILVQNFKTKFKSILKYVGQIK